MKQKNSYLSKGGRSVKLHTILGIPPVVYVNGVLLSVLLLGLLQTCFVPMVSLNIETSPQRSAVYLDDVLVGSTPFKGRFPAKTYRVRLERPFFDSIEFSYSLKRTAWVFSKRSLEASLSINDLDRRVKEFFIQINHWGMLYAKLNQSYQSPPLWTNFVQDLLLFDSADVWQDLISPLLRDSLVYVSHPLLLADFLEALCLAEISGNFCSSYSSKYLKKSWFIYEQEQDAQYLQSLIGPIWVFLQESGVLETYDRGVLLWFFHLFGSDRTLFEAYPWFALAWNGAQENFNTSLVPLLGSSDNGETKTQQHQVYNLQVVGPLFPVLRVPASFDNPFPGFFNFHYGQDQRYYTYLGDVERPVFLTRNFVTQADFARFIEADRFWHPDNLETLVAQNQVDKKYLLDYDDNFLTSLEPIRYISYHAAQAYAIWFSSYTGRKYTLPTEAYWTNNIKSSLQRGETLKTPYLWEWTQTPYYPRDGLLFKEELKPAFNEVLRAHYFTIKSVNEGLEKRAVYPASFCSPVNSMRLMLQDYLLEEERELFF